MEQQHCSVLAAVREEPMAGTAFTQGGLLLVEQPGAWGRTGLAESDFDREIARELDRRAGAAGLRLLAIRPLGHFAGGRRRWALRLPGDAATRWGSYDADAELLDLPLDGSVGEPDDGALYLVCTHAKRDRCCALFGRPIAEALEDLAPGRVWGCSHTGGHRFAPVVVTIPPRRAGAALHGRVSARDVPELVAATEAGRTLPRLLRGLVGHPAPVQAALAHVGAGYDDWVVSRVERDPLQDSTHNLSLTGPDGSVPLRVTAYQAQEPMVSCGKPDPAPQTHYRVMPDPAASSAAP
jgi:hypothetical protein